MKCLDLNSGKRATNVLLSNVPNLVSFKLKAKVVLSLKAGLETK